MKATAGMDEYTDISQIHYNSVIMGTMVTQIPASRLFTYGLFRSRSKKTSKLRATGLCEGNSPVTDKFPAQRASNAENVSIWWCHHDFQKLFINGIPIDNISEYAFRGLPDLQELVMTNCQLSVPPPIAPIRKTLRYLELGENNLTYIPADYFTRCNVLDKISLGNNWLSTVPDIRFLNATLRIFLLNYNIITHIESLYFVPMMTLKTLDLSGNLITEIEFDKAIWLSIMHISLDNNRLASIKTSELSRVWGKVVVTVRGNPWHKWPFTRKMFPFDDVIMHYGKFMPWNRAEPLIAKWRYKIVTHERDFFTYT